MSDPCPVSVDTLAAYWSGDLAEDRQDALEEHLFACAACSARSGRMAAVVQLLRATIPPVVSAARVERMAAQGVRLRTTEVPPGAAVTVVFSREVDLLVHRLRADLADAQRVDCEVCGGDGTRLFLLEQVPFDRQRGEVLIACQRHYADLGPPDILFRVTAHAADRPARVSDHTVLHVFE